VNVSALPGNIFIDFSRRKRFQSTCGSW